MTHVPLNSLPLFLNTSLLITITPQTLISKINHITLIPNFQNFKSRHSNLTQSKITYNSFRLPKIHGIIFMEIKIREVWSHNLDEEFTLIRSIVDDFPFITMDTEFPGVIYRINDRNDVLPSLNYSVMKQNVDVLNIIQFGLTLCDEQGNFPSLGSDKFTFIWQFNFKDFDVSRDSHAPDSVEMLRGIGIDFERNVESGVDSWRFGELMMSSGLVCNADVAWVTFHGAYDFGYLLKMLTQRSLPEELEEFTTLISVFFGEKVFDVKYMIRSCNGLYGGLERVASTLKIDRTVGKSHQAASDSLLTWLVFQRIRDGYFDHYGGIGHFAGSYYGLREVS